MKKFDMFEMVMSFVVIFMLFLLASIPTNTFCGRYVITERPILVFIGIKSPTKYSCYKNTILMEGDQISPLMNK